MEIYLLSLAVAIAAYALWPHTLRLLLRAGDARAHIGAAVIRAVAWALGRERGAKFRAALAEQIAAEPDPVKRAEQLRSLELSQ